LYNILEGHFFFEILLDGHPVDTGPVLLAKDLGKLDSGGLLIVVVLGLPLKDGLGGRIHYVAGV
jgi:hypothetical protein